MIDAADHARTRRGLAIVPAYNERESIAAVVESLREHAPTLDILVVDDGSADDTFAHVPGPARVARLPFNLGIGGAMQTGYRYAARHGYDVAIQVDGDGQHPPDQISLLLERLDAGDVDFVIGSRFLAPSGYRQEAARVAGRHLLSALIRVLTGHRITDCTSGFRAANRRVIEAFAHWYPDDYPEPEVVLLLDRARFRLAEVAVNMNRRTGGTSSIRMTHGLFYVVKVGLALVLDMFRRPWPDESAEAPPC